VCAERASAERASPTAYAEPGKLGFDMTLLYFSLEHGKFPWLEVKVSGKWLEFMAELVILQGR